MKSAFRALLCDMDGTLYNSMPLHARAWHEMTADLGLDIPVDEFFAYEGMTGAATIDLIFRRDLHRPATDDEKIALYKRKTEIFKHLQETVGISVMPGAQDIVAAAQRASLVTVLVTGSGQGSLIDRLDHDFPGAFPLERRITARSVTHGKPHPEPYLRAARLAGFPPHQCIALENAPLGVRSAHAAGCFTLGVSTGPIPIADLSDAGADRVYFSMPDCTKHFPALL